MSNIQRYNSASESHYITRDNYSPAPSMNGMQKFVFIIAVLYWFSPIDLIPFVPIDDIGMVIMALIINQFIGSD